MSPWRRGPPFGPVSRKVNRLPGGSNEMDFALPLDQADPGGDGPPAVPSLQAIDVPPAGDNQGLRRIPVGADEHVVRLLVRLIARDLGGVVQQVVLVARLRRVVVEGPVDEIVYGTDGSDAWSSIAPSW